MIAGVVGVHEEEVRLTLLKATVGPIARVVPHARARAVPLHYVPAFLDVVTPCRRGART